ncbi:3-phosphoglycerate dehydrogenase, partial [PVC group bacterium]|nr:3-phosphoglycerate dehydrogenase [PVC group bacterium]
GNIINSVNFPACSLERTSTYRLLIANRNIPNMVGQISTILAREDINIVEMLNKSRDEIAYNIIDISSHASKAIIQAMAKTKGVVTVRLLSHE